MPIYEYMCNACGHEMETLQAISEAPLRDCPECGQAELRKLISAPIFRLKGGGWYETDFKTNNKRNLAGDAAAESKSSETKVSESKSAAGKSAEGKSVKSNKDSGGKPESSTRASSEA
ncbi:MAG: zinc ribbon domain-containing protein [Nitrococcus mobilis]|nr:zinc ribbon domain-containing protein [Nitrococcus mobilis]